MRYVWQRTTGMPPHAPSCVTAGQLHATYGAGGLLRWLGFTQENPAGARLNAVWARQGPAGGEPVPARTRAAVQYCVLLSRPDADVGPPHGRVRPAVLIKTREGAVPTDPQALPHAKNASCATGGCVPSVPRPRAVALPRRWRGYAVDLSKRPLGQTARAKGIDDVRAAAILPET